MFIKDEDDKMAEQNASSDNGTENNGEVKKKYDPKDPHRPRRKKARRACFACQRAHLTCGKPAQFLVLTREWFFAPRVVIAPALSAVFVCRVLVSTCPYYKTERADIGAVR
jgi:hypothetical protein